LGQSAQNYAGKSNPLPNMLLRMLTTENVTFIIIAAILVFVAFVFFAVLYAVDFKDSRKKAKKRREYHRALMQAQKKKRNPAAGNELSRES
jgi:signal transduction histidine kinase